VSTTLLHDERTDDDDEQSLKSSRAFIRRDIVFHLLTLLHAFHAAFSAAAILYVDNVQYDFSVFQFAVSLVFVTFSSLTLHYWRLNWPSSHAPAKDDAVARRAEISRQLSRFDLRVLVVAVLFVFPWLFELVSYLARSTATSFAQPLTGAVFVNLFVVYIGWVIVATDAFGATPGINSPFLFAWVEARDSDGQHPRTTRLRRFVAQTIADSLPDSITVSQLFPVNLETEDTKNL
jgi:hypothetical protein